MEKLKQLLIDRRNIRKAGLIAKETAENGYFDVNDMCGGNMDDAFSLGMEIGEAELIEEILSILNLNQI